MGKINDNPKINLKKFKQIYSKNLYILEFIMIIHDKYMEEN